MAEGFAAVPTAMLRDESVSMHAVMVYAVLASYGGYEVVAPKRETIAKFARCSVRKVADALNELEELGVLERERRTNSRGQATTCYVLVTGRRAVKASGALTDRVEAPSASGGGTSEQVTPIYTDRESEIDNPQTPTGGELLETLFFEAWEYWPKKTEKKASLAKFKVKVREQFAGRPGDLVEQILRFGQAYAATTETRFVPALSAWLNRERWTDPLPAPSQARRTAVEVMADRARSMQGGGGPRELSA